MPYTSRRRYRPRRRLVRRTRRPRNPYRPTRLRRTYRRRMTRRSLLNVTSTKKRDSMLTWIPNDFGNPAGAGAPGNVILDVNNTNVKCVLFCPTFRDLDSDGTLKDEISARTKTDTFAKGYRETTTVSFTGSGIPLRRRRIVFSAKGLPTYFAGATGNLFTSPFYALYTSAGYVRLGEQLPSAYITVLTSILFQGTQSQDWNSVFTAKPDNSRLKVHSDRSYNYSSGNENGFSRIHKDYYPLNKLFRYADDESAQNETSSPFSTFSTTGMGDLFVVDFYQALTTSASGSWQVNHEGTYYWHER